jgi:hypothetical protein
MSLSILNSPGTEHVHGDQRWLKGRKDGKQEQKLREHGSKDEAK